MLLTASPLFIGMHKFVQFCKIFLALYLPSYSHDQCIKLERKFKNVFEVSIDFGLNGLILRRKCRIMNVPAQRHISHVDSLGDRGR